MVEDEKAATLAIAVVDEARTTCDTGETGKTLVEIEIAEVVEDSDAALDGVDIPVEAEEGSIKVEVGVQGTAVWNEVALWLAWVLTMGMVW